MKDLSDLTPQLLGLEGWRIEATIDGETRRFIVGRSTGVKPVHLEVKTRRSLGGQPAEKRYNVITILEKVY
jgi:hypothetical protein